MEDENFKAENKEKENNFNSWIASYIIKCVLFCFNSLKECVF